MEMTVPPPHPEIFGSRRIVWTVTVGSPCDPLRRLHENAKIGIVRSLQANRMQIGVIKHEWLIVFFGVCQKRVILKKSVSKKRCKDSNRCVTSYVKLRHTLLNRKRILTEKMFFNIISKLFLRYAGL